MLGTSTPAHHILRTTSDHVLTYKCNVSKGLHGICHKKSWIHTDTKGYYLGIKPSSCLSNHTGASHLHSFALKNIRLCLPLRIDPMRGKPKHFSGYDLQKFTARFSQCEGIAVGNGTVQLVCVEYATRRRQFKKTRLNWRVSDPESAKYSLVRAAE